MREFFGLLLFAVLLFGWSKIFATPENKSVDLSLDPETSVTGSIR